MLKKVALLNSSREIYLRPFEIVVKTADPWCLMTSYPKINGTHVDASDEFLGRILRQEWGYSGLVMSDWGATTSTVASLEAGSDRYLHTMNNC